MSKELKDTPLRVVNAYRHLMTEGEGRAHLAFNLQTKMEAQANRDLIQHTFEAMQQALNDPEAAQLFKKGRELFLNDTAQRILDNYGHEVRRCSRCGGILRTPRAKQCLDCGYDWHTSNTEELSP